MFPGKWYDEVRVGDRFGTSVTVTETHLVLGSGLFGDFNPLHVDEEFSRRSMFGGRILHGPFTSALVSAPVGMYFSGTALAYLEHACRFKKGNRIRLEIVNGDSPITDVLWTHYYQPDKIGQDTLWHSSKYPSALVLPVME